MERPKVMVLGTFHMRYTPDLYRINVADLLNDNRQQEIRDVIEKIKAFKPTMLAFEVIKGEQEELNKEYKKYLNNEIKLKVDEVHQYGFRIASELKHSQVYAIDWMESIGNMGIGQVFEWAKANQPELYDYIDKKYRSDRDFNLTDKSIVDLMRESNSETNIRKGHEMNMAIARIASEEDYVGIDWLRWWYQRNLIIYSNLAEISNSSSDRIILIIGHAHVYLISQFLRESGMFDVESAMSYL